MNLVIDIGNSRIKTAVFEKREMLLSRTIDKHDEIWSGDMFTKFPDIKSCIISSVREHDQVLGKKLLEQGIKTTYLNSDTALPFASQYRTPESLGKDRIAAVAGAVYLYPGKDLLVIDAGTAITYDLFSHSEGYLGGNISPGLNLRFRALNTFTDKLPLLTPDNSTELLGDSTESAIRIGVQNGLLFELEAYLTKISKKYPQIAVILTGGDAQFFDNKLKKSIFVVQNLTLVGLNFILDYNAKTF